MLALTNTADSISLSHSGGVIDGDDGPNLTISIDAVETVPEPAVLALLGLGLVAVGARRLS